MGNGNVRPSAYAAIDYREPPIAAARCSVFLRGQSRFDQLGNRPNVIGNRLVSLSEEGRMYLRAQQDSVKRSMLKHFAIRPKWIAHFWPEWRSSPPPDEIRLDALVLTHKFNENAAPKFLKVYDDTIAFAGLSESDKIPIVETDQEDEEGDVEHSDEDTSSESGGKKRKVNLMAGERELTTGLLSKDANFRLIVSGDVGVKEIERLIKKLELDKEILADASSDESKKSD